MSYGNNSSLSLEQIPLLQQQSVVTPGSESGLAVTVIYQDAVTRQWALEVWERVAGLVGAAALHVCWWKLEDLSQSAVLAEAVSTALRADVLMVAIRASEGFPLPFYVWVNSWLPHRPASKAALVALISFPDSPSLALDRGREYLRAVARQGRLDFVLEERRLPDAVDQKSCVSGKTWELDAVFKTADPNEQRTTDRTGGNYFHGPPRDDVSRPA
jgi:hypothetical protein